MNHVKYISIYIVLVREKFKPVLAVDETTATTSIVGPLMDCHVLDGESSLILLQFQNNVLVFHLSLKGLLLHHSSELSVPRHSNHIFGLESSGTSLS